MELAAATKMYEKLKESVFTEATVGLVHGRMKPEEKDAVMEGFKAGDTDILVSTTVVEVGVDVPNATVMVIEHAERFGLAQLHQLRGRVGQGRPAVVLHTDGGTRRVRRGARAHSGAGRHERRVRDRGEGPRDARTGRVPRRETARAADVLGGGSGARLTPARGGAETTPSRSWTATRTMRTEAGSAPARRHQETVQGPRGVHGRGMRRFDDQRRVPSPLSRRTAGTRICSSTCWRPRP